MVVPGEGSPRNPVWIIGRDPGEQEVRRQRPLCGPSGAVLNRALQQAGWPIQVDATGGRAPTDLLYIDNIVPKRPPGNDFARHDPGTVAWGRGRIQALASQYQPTLIITLGTEAMHTFVHTDAKISDARGYLWDTQYGRVLTAMHPAAILRDWVPWAMLFTLDLRKAHREYTLGAPPLPDRHVSVVYEDGAGLRAALRDSAWLAMDIENTANLELSCLGIANEAEAWVVPATNMDLVRAACTSDVPKVLQNGQYDRFFLERFCDITLRNQVFDTQLAWHALQPELAGKQQRPGGRKKYSRRTVKSLAFLASIYTRDPWWKDYDFATEEARYKLCGRDCLITLEIARKMREQLEQQ